MAASVPSFPQYHLGTSLGAGFLGNVSAAILYGITCVQTYLYFKRSQDDPFYLKASVSVLWVLDSLHLALITYSIYTYAVTNFGNPLILETPNRSVLAHVMVTGLSDVIVRGLYCQRVWRLSDRNKFVALAIIITSLVVFVGSLAFPIRAFTISTFIGLETISWVLYTSFAAGAAADFIIAGSLCFLLYRRRTGFSRRTDSILAKLMIYAVNTGALTSFCALACLATYATMPDNFIFLAIYFTLPKLLLNSLLATLNARKSLRQTETHVSSIPLSRTAVSDSNISSRNSFNPSKKKCQEHLLRIQVQTTTDVKADTVSQAGTEPASLV